MAYQYLVINYFKMYRPSKLQLFQDRGRVIIAGNGTTKYLGFNIGVLIVDVYVIPPANLP